MACSVFAINVGAGALCIIFAIPDFIGWILPYFCSSKIYAAKSEKITSLIDNKYDEIYEVSKRVNVRLMETKGIIVVVVSTGVTQKNQSLEI